MHYRVARCLRTVRLLKANGGGFVAPTQRSTEKAERDGTKIVSLTQGWIATS